MMLYSTIGSLIPIKHPYLLTFKLGELLLLLFSVFQIGYLLGCQTSRNLENQAKIEEQTIRALPIADNNLNEANDPTNM